MFRSWKAVAVFGVAVASLEGVSGATQQPDAITSAQTVAVRFDIDARIVQTSRDAASALGVAWGVPNLSTDLAVGSVNGATLDAALSGLERSGKGRILSAPRVSTPNNIEAEIVQGVRVPSQAIANNTITVTWKEESLSLRVLPQVVPANTVDMRVVLENGLGGSARIRMANGGTMVIGSKLRGRDLLIFITPRIIA